MQSTGVTKALGAGIAAIVAMFALWGVLFAAQPAYAADEIAAGTSAIGDLSAQVQGPQTATVRIGETLTIKNVKNTAKSQGKCTWTVKTSNKKIATAKVSGTGTTAKVSVKGVADGNATITVTCTNASKAKDTHKIKVKVTGIKNKTTYKGFIYKRTGIDTVTLVKPKGNKDQKNKSLKIPATIKVQDKKKGNFKATYKVTAIGKGGAAFQKTAKTVTVGKNVKTIGKHAFCNNSKMTKLIIGKNVKKLGAYMVHKGDKKLKTIVIKSTKLTKKSVKNCLKYNKTVKTVKVPASKLKAYKKIFTKANCGAKVKVTK